MKMNYLKNIELALSLGYEEVQDANAYGGRYFIKNGLIWIHNIEALKLKLSLASDQNLSNLKYDVDSYYRYVDFTNELVDVEIEKIKSKIFDSESLLSGHTDLLNKPEILEGMARLSAEGFDEEILYDYAHQISKN